MQAPDVLSQEEQATNVDYWALFQEHKDFLFALLRRYERDENEIADICSEAMLRGQSGFSTMANPQKFRNWIVQIALNIFKSRVRHTKTQTYPHSFRDGDEACVRDKIPSAYQRVVELETFERLQAAVHNLPAREQRIIRGQYWSNLSSKQLGKNLGISQGAVHTYASRAKRQIRKSLEA